MTIALSSDTEGMLATAPDPTGPTGVPTADATTTDMPTRIVAQSFRGGTIEFGLGTPLDLRGGDRIGPAGMAMELPFADGDALTSYVVTACREQSIAGRNWFRLPPAVLVGREGSGRTHIARQIARLAGVPFATLEVGGSEGERRLRSDGRSPDLVLPPLPVLAMATARCANPVILLTGVQDVSSVGAAILAGMLDPRSSDRVVVESIGARFDFSEVTWLVSASQYGVLDRTITRNTVEIQLESPEAGPLFKARLLGILLEAMTDLEIDDGERTTIGRELLSSTDWVPRERSASALYVAATAYLLRWLSPQG